MPIRSILLVRLSAIGDIVLASGVVPALRRAYPRARIDWLAQQEGGELLATCGDLDQVLLWPRADWTAKLKKGRILQVWPECREFIRRLRSREYDLAIDMQGLGKSALFAALSGARRRMGLNSREGSGWLMQEVMATGPDDKIASEYKALLSRLGVECSDYSLGLQPTQEDQSEAKALLRGQGVAKGYIAVCPFTTRAQKHWPKEHWGRLLPELGRITGLKPLLLGGAKDRSAAERIRALAGEEVIKLAGETTLPQSLALIQGADLVLGVDTGLTHMAVLSNRPTIALFGSTRPYLTPEKDNSLVLYRAYTCSPCKRRPVCRDYHCMQAITPEEVLQGAKGLLGI